MSNPFRRAVSSATGPLVPVLLLCLLSLALPLAFAQSAAPPTGLYKQLGRIDLAVSVNGILSTSVSGDEQRDAAGSTVGVATGATTVTTVTSPTLLVIKPSSTVGTLVSLRYIKKPMLGFEFNFDHSRFTQNFTFTDTTKTTTTTTSPPSTTTTTAANNLGLLAGGSQNGVNELTLGYVAHPHKLFGIPTYLGAGGGPMRFKPTPYGGQGLPEQYRAAYYYEAGVEDNFPSSHFGVRLGFRQLIYLAPDFGQNYLTITRRTRTSEPSFGFFVHF
jgi:hypothetical protein